MPATERYEAACDKVAAFWVPDRVTRSCSRGPRPGSTSSPTVGGRAARPDDRIVVTEMEHHANRCPADAGPPNGRPPRVHPGRGSPARLERLTGSSTRHEDRRSRGCRTSDHPPLDVILAAAREVGAFSTSTAPSSCPTSPSTSPPRRRCPRVLRSQDVRPHRHRCQPGRNARGAGAIEYGGDMIAPSPLHGDVGPDTNASKPALPRSSKR